MLEQSNLLRHFDTNNNASLIHRVDQNNYTNLPINAFLLEHHFKNIVCSSYGAGIFCFKLSLVVITLI